MRTTGSSKPGSDRPKPASGHHLASTSFHIGLLKQVHHPKSELSLNLDRSEQGRPHLKSFSRLNQTQESIPEVNAGMLLAKTKLLSEMLHSKEQYLLEDLEQDRLQIANMESNLKIITNSVKTLKEILLNSVASRSRTLTQLRTHSPQPSSDQLLLEFSNFLKQKNANTSKEQEQLMKSVLSSKSQNSGKFITGLGPNSPLHFMPSARLAKQNNLSMDSYGRMNLSNPTISDQGYDQYDPSFASKSSAKNLLPSNSQKNYKNLYAGIESSHSKITEEEPNVFVSKLKLNSEGLVTRGIQIPKFLTNEQKLLGSLSNRVLQAPNTGESFLTQRELRTPDFQEIVGSAKKKSLTPRQPISNQFAVAQKVQTVALATTPRSPRVESFLAKIGTLINSKSTGGFSANKTADNKKKDFSMLKPAATPKITTLKLAPHTVIYGPGKKLQPGKALSTSAIMLAQGKRAHVARDSAVPPLSVIEEHSTSQVGTVMKESPRKGAAQEYFLPRNPRQSSSPSKSRISGPTQLLKKGSSLESVNEVSKQSRMLMSVDTGSIPFGNKKPTQDVSRSHYKEPKKMSLVGKGGLRQSSQKRSHKLLFQSMMDHSGVGENDQISNPPGQVSELDWNAHYEDPSLLTKRDEEDDQVNLEGVSGVASNIQRVLSIAQEHKLNRSLDSRGLNNRSSPPTPDTHHLKFNPATSNSRLANSTKSISSRKHITIEIDEA